jgi:hypothetical protein
MKKTLLFVAFVSLVQIIQAQWLTAGSNIYYSSGYVGIETTPSCSLDVAGMIHSNYSLILDQPAGGNIGGWFRGGANSSGNIVVHGNQGNWSAWWVTGSYGYMKLGTGGGNETWAGGVNIDQSNHVGINTLNTSGYTLNVNGTAVFDGVTVKSFSSNGTKATPWADYVFDKNYELPSLQSVAAYIKANSHLPGMLTAAEVQKNGLDLGANQAKLLEKIEQLTLYAIDLQNQVNSLKAQNEKFADLQRQIDELRNNTPTK